MSRTSHPSVLLMESHGLAPNVRSTSFASINVWSKLYQAGPYFLDLSLEPGEHNLDLRGEILSSDDPPLPTEAEITLYDEHGQRAVAQLGDAGFSLPLDQAGLYRLEVSYEAAVLTVEGLKIG
jgi:hypothetical protein